MNNILKKIFLGLATVFFLLFLFSTILPQKENLLNISPTVAYAQNSIHDDLTPGCTTCNQSRWLFNSPPVAGRTSTVGVWSLLLGLANAFVAIVLFFFAFVNIAHIQYDTYQLKKVLPNLIIGIVLANFSMLICRLLVDIASVIVITFLQKPDELGSGLMRSICFSTNDASGIADLVIKALATTTGVSLIVLIVVVIILAIGILLASLLLWIRKTVIFILAAVSPLAFIMMAFPPTEQYFKKWWDWEIKYVFMGPITIFLIWLAAMIGRNNCDPFSLAAMFSTIGLVYLSFIVPFLLGGAPMAFANKIGKGAGKGLWKGATQNPWAKASRAHTLQRLNDSFQHTGIGRSWRGAEAAEQDYTKLRETQTKGSQDEGRLRRGREQSEIDLQIKTAEDISTRVATRLDENMNRIEQGTLLEGLTEADVASITGHGTAMQSAEHFLQTANRANIAKNALSKRRDIDLNLASMRDLKDNVAIRAQMDNALYEIDPETGRPIEDADGNRTVRADAQHNIDGIRIQERDSDGHDLGTQRMVTYGETIDMAADFRAKAKAAATEPERTRLNQAAEQYETQATEFRNLNETDYNYDAVLDRNTSGRRYKEINPRVMEEAKTTFDSTTGRQAVHALDGAHGTAEYRGDRDSADNFLVGRHEQIEDTAAFAAAQQVQAVNMHMREGANGNAEGMIAIQAFKQRVHDAHQRTGAEYTYTTRVLDAASGQMVNQTHTVNATENGHEVLGAINHESLSNMSPDQARTFLEQNCHITVPPGDQEQLDIALNDARVSGALDNIDVSRLTVDNTQQGQANKAFIARNVSTFQNRRQIGLSGNPGAPISHTNPNAYHHTHEPIPAGGGGAPGTGGTPGTGGAPGGPADGDVAP